MADSQDSADREAIRRTLSGDADAFAELVSRYQSAVYTCTLGITGSPEDAADAAQEAFVRLYRHLDQYNPRHALKPYLMKIAVNSARSIVRKRPARDWPEAEDAELASLADDSPSPGQAWWRLERRRAVREGLASLPAMLRDACVLFYLNGFSCRETAGILDTSEGAIKTALHRARRKLANSPLRDWMHP